MRVAVLLCIWTSVALPSAARAAEPVVATGVWYGTYVPAPFDGSRSGPSLQRQAVFYVLSVDAAGEELTGSLAFRGIPTSPTGLAQRAAASLGVGPTRLYEGLEGDPFTGVLAGSKITIETHPVALVTVAFGSTTQQVLNPRGAITADGTIKGDQMRLTLVARGRDARLVRLERCVPSDGRTVADACSGEALWQLVMEREARRNRGGTFSMGGVTPRFPRDEPYERPQTE